MGVIRGIARTRMMTQLCCCSATKMQGIVRGFDTIYGVLSNQDLIWRVK